MKPKGKKFRIRRTGAAPGSAASPVTIAVATAMYASVELAEYHHNVPLTRSSVQVHRRPVSATRSASHCRSHITDAGRSNGPSRYSPSPGTRAAASS